MGGDDRFLSLDAHQWGMVGLVANLVSVTVQLTNLLRTKHAKSFSMVFIGLMTLLNAWYAFVAYLHGNTWFAASALLFMVYNIVVIAHYYAPHKKA